MINCHLRCITLYAGSPTYSIHRGLIPFISTARITANPLNFALAAFAVLGSCCFWWLLLLHVVGSIEVSELQFTFPIFVPSSYNFYAYIWCMPHVQDWKSLSVLAETFYEARKIYEPSLCLKLLERGCELCSSPTLFLLATSAA